MRLVISLALLFCSGLLQAQPNTYLADLATLKSTLQKTPSYRAQIKGSLLANYEALYTRLAADSLHPTNSYTYFYNLCQLLFPLKDNHLGFYQKTDYAHFQNKETIEQFVQSKEFLDYPKLNINTDSLKAALANKPTDSLEGIYHYDKFYSVGLFKSGDKEYTGVIVDTDVNLWQKGQIAMRLYEFQPHLYKAIYGHPLTKNFILQPIEKYRNQTLVNSYFYASYSQQLYSKNLQAVDHVNLPRGGARFELKNMAHDIQYLLLKSFQLNPTTIRESNRFYDSIKNAVTAPYLILDLRNNEGGSQKATRSYYKLLKNYSRKGKLYILLNNETLSRAELFTLQLKRLKDVTTVGQTTFGKLNYGSNFGKRVKLPSGRFELYPTDLKSPARLLPYENAGIDPDIFLHNNADWLEQVIEIIRKQ